MKIKKGFIIRKVGGENIVVPIGAAAKDFHGMVKLNESGAFLWNFFCKGHTTEEAVQAILETYDVDEKTAREDVIAFVSAVNQPYFVENDD